MKNFYTIAAVLILFCSCKPPAGYTITGNVTGFPDSTMIRLRNMHIEEDIDSALVMNGRFVLKGQLPETPESFWLHTTLNDKFIYANLFIGNDDVKVEGDIADFPWNVKITGSKTHDEYAIEHNLTKDLYIERSALFDEYYKLSSELQAERHKEFSREIDSLYKAIIGLQKEFAASHYDTYAGVLHLGYTKDMFPKDSLQVIYDRIPDEIKRSRFARGIEIYLKEKISEVGDMCHDFEAVDQKGDTIRFHDLLDGRYILLNFTSYGCGPCVESMPELRLISEKFSDSLRIVSFSCDAGKENWSKSLERDGMTWPYLWDGKGLSGETCIKYGVTGRPIFFIIDPQGIIINKLTGYGTLTGSDKGFLEYFLYKNSVPSNSI